MSLLATRKYFFGYLFVRLAKAIAVAIVLIGAGFILFKYAQAANAADAVAYRASVALDQRLDRLSASFNRTARLVMAFNSGAEAAKFTNPRFPRLARSDGDFENLRMQLAKIDQNRERMKQLVIDRFESAAGNIEKRLRDHAASLRAGARPSPTVVPATIPSASPIAPAAALPKEEQETLFSRGVSKHEIDDRFSKLEAAKTFLAALEARAENLESRKSLFDSITEIEALKKLLPVRIDSTIEANPSPTPVAQSPADAASVTEARTLARAEQVANQLAAYRGSVRDSMLSAWAVDDAYDEASEFAGAESNKCRSASLLVSGIWLSAFGQMAIFLIASLFLAFIILVMADLTQTLLDTATNTGVTADASRKN